MAFLVEILPAIVSAIFNCFRASQMEFEHVFDNLTFKHMDALSRGGSRPELNGGGGNLHSGRQKRAKVKRPEGAQIFLGLYSVKTF